MKPFRNIELFIQAYNIFHVNKKQKQFLPVQETQHSDEKKKYDFLKILVQLRI